MTANPALGPTQPTKPNPNNTANSGSQHPGGGTQMGLGVTNPNGNKGTPFGVLPRTVPKTATGSSSGQTNGGCEAISEVNPDPSCFGGGSSSSAKQPAQSPTSTSTQVTNAPYTAPSYAPAAQAIADIISGIADVPDDDTQPMPDAGPQPGPANADDNAPPQGPVSRPPAAASADDGQPADSGVAQPPTAPSAPIIPVEQQEAEISGAFDGSIAQYHTMSPEYVADVKDAAETFAKLQADSIRQGDADALATTQNLAAATYLGVTGVAIDAAVPKNGDPANDSMNDFLHSADHIFQTEPGTLSGALDRVKMVFKDVTGNAQHNLECLGQMIKLEKGDCQ
jgi:hypothetical protein